VGLRRAPIPSLSSRSDKNSIPADRVERTRPRVNHTLFQADDGVQGDNGPIRQLLAGPSEKRASCPNLLV
jgi:hypothetical protein